MIKYLFFRVTEKGKENLKKAREESIKVLDEMKMNFGIDFEEATLGKGPFNPTKIPKGVELTPDRHIADKGKGRAILHYWREKVEPKLLTPLSVWKVLECEFPANSPTVHYEERPEDLFEYLYDVYFITTTGFKFSPELLEEIDANTYYELKSQWISEIIAIQAGEGGA